MQNFIQEDNTGFFQIIYEVVETHDYESDVTIFRTPYKMIAEKFVQEKTVHSLKHIKYREEGEEVRNHIHHKVKEILGENLYASLEYDYEKETKKQKKIRIEYEEKYNEEFYKQQDNLPIELRAKLFAEYYAEDYLEHLEIKEKKLYLEFKKKCLLDPCTKEILRDVLDADKILEILT